ncbi:MAG: cytochrome c3 family protein [Deltaproteobacteria bacterium]|nr:cytochrome c3 family protein [Deltaproteobacteria bacterium]
MPFGALLADHGPVAMFGLRAGPKILVVSLMAASFPAWAQVGISSSKHDFSSGGTGGIWGSTNTNQICVFCHAPHKAVTQPLLWNRTLPNGSIFTLYNSGSLSGPQPAAIKAESLRCLACHDGSVAIDQFSAGRTWVPAMFSIGDVYYPGGPYSGGANIGGNYGGLAINDLSDDHPISIVYDDARATADGRLALPSSGLGGLPLFSSTLECGTCHEVHRQYPFPFLLRMSNAGSALCRTCHLK